MQHVMGLVLKCKRQLLAEQTVSDGADCHKLDPCPEQPDLACRQAEDTMQPVMWWTQPRARLMP